MRSSACFARTLLPEEHLGEDTKDVVKLGIALIATMAALVLGLLIASAKSAYDTRRGQPLEVSADIILLDRIVANDGAETEKSHAMLQHSVAVATEQFWPDRDQPAATDRRATSVEALYDTIQDLTPHNDAHRSLQNQALTISFDLGRTRVLVVLAVIFASLGLFAPRNGTVVATFLVCAISVSVVIFLILELVRSFEGVLQVPSAPLRAALAQLGQ